MTNSKKTTSVLIPLSIFKQILDVLECCDVFRSGLSVQIQHNDVLCALRAKQDCLELRDTYSNIVHAKNDDQRNFACEQYLKHKSFVHAEKGGGVTQ